jgi:periplasmic divalent cation tolerance protein
MSWETEVNDVLVLFCTVPDQATGVSIARTLVGEQLAACVNLVPGLRSVYRWKGELCDDPEVLLMIKTTRGMAPSLAERVAQLHPYDTPEVIALPVQAGLLPYVQWVRAMTG